MEYDKEFEGWFGSWWIWGDFSSKRLAKEAAWCAWQAARKDHYRIGEEVEAQQIGAPWKKGIVMAVVYSNNNYYIEEPELVRKIQAKSRIDEIAEDCWHEINKGVTGLPVEVIKRAILNARHEWESNR